MKLNIGSFNPKTKTVPVTFTHGAIIHMRPVNAVIRDNGTHDRAATIERVNDVARGVAEKIRLGAITSAPSATADEPKND